MLPKPHGLVRGTELRPPGVDGQDFRSDNVRNSFDEVPAACNATKDAYRQLLALDPRAVSEAQLPLPDVLLIAEDLLLQARRLAESGAPQEAVLAILDQVAALREGRS